MDSVVPSLAVVFASTLAFVLLKPKRQSVPYPPGPPPKLLVGNAFDIPAEKPWIRYRDLSREFNSDMIHLVVMNKHIVVLNKAEDALTLFGKRSATYSSRSQIPVFDILGASHITPMLEYGSDWRKHRKFYQEGLRKELMPLYTDVYTEKVHLLLGQLLRSPEKFMDHGRWLAAAIVMAITFGHEYPPDQGHDHLVEHAEKTVNGLSALFLPGSTLVNIFPFLKHIPPWVPGATTQKFAAEIKSSINMYRNEPFEFVERQLAAGTARPTLLGRILQRSVKKDGVYEDEELLKDTILTTFLGGVETLHSAMMFFFMAMALYPDVQKRAQEEIDLVVGEDRLPNFEDRESLPYIDAILRETLRWRPMAPQGLPHTTSSDDVYKGFYFPKGTTVIPNVWAMMRDEEFYPDPDSFRPERFFNDDGTLNDDTVDFAFGFGRRICPGRHIVDSELWLTIVSVLSVFSVTKARDEKGEEIEIDADATSDTVICAPLPFKCSVTPRSSHAIDVIRTSILALNSTS